MRGAMVLFLILLHLALFLNMSTSAANEPVAAVAHRRLQVGLLRERTTLLGLKRELNLSSSSDLADWSESNGYICSFTGVTCDRRREHVVGLDLANMGISGAIPPVIGELSHLWSLDVSNNSFSSVPATIGNLMRLRRLFVNDNLISGAILPVISNLSQLRSLDISNNRMIFGTLPPALGSLWQLQSLNISYNYISGAIPPSISNLTLLTDLIMDHNFISGGIPVAIGNLTSLENLDISINNLTGHIPAELSKLRSLAALDLSNNQLDGGIPLSLSELAGMFYLSIHRNKLSGTIPAAIFLNCTELGVVDLGSNNLSGEIPRTGSLTLAETFAVLNLYSNKLTGKLPPWLANCSYLYGLDVEDNMLNDELPTTIISGKKYLSYLHLSSNHFRSQDGNRNLEPFLAAMSTCSTLQQVAAGAVGMGGQLLSRLS